MRNTSQVRNVCNANLIDAAQCLDSGRSSVDLAALQISFNRAIATHQEWRVIFEDALRRGGDDFRVEAIRADDRCELGRCLHSHGEELINDASALAFLREIHGEFHHEAARVLALAQLGRVREAMVAVRINSQYARWSDMLVAGLSGYNKNATRACD